MTNPMRERSKRKVAVWLRAKKASSLGMPSLVEVAKRRGVEMVVLELDDTETSLEVQAEGCQVLLYKISHLHVKATQSNDQASIDKLNRLNRLVKLHPEMKLVDDFNDASVTLDREGIYRALRHIRLPERVQCPRSYLAASCQEAAARMDSMGLTFPVMCKSQLAGGSNHSHYMWIVFKKEGFDDAAFPCLVQEYIEHDGFVAKVSVIGTYVHIGTRASIDTIAVRKLAGNRPSLYFDSHISSGASESAVTAAKTAIHGANTNLRSQLPSVTLGDIANKAEAKVDCQITGTAAPCSFVHLTRSSPVSHASDAKERSWQPSWCPGPEGNALEDVVASSSIRSLFEDIAMKIGTNMGLTLFGIDIIYSPALDKFFLVDVNYFPSFRFVPSMHDRLVDLLESCLVPDKRVIDKTK